MTTQTSQKWNRVKLGDIYKFQYGKGNTNPSNGGQYPVYGAGRLLGYFDKYNAENSPVIGHMGANCGTVIFGRGKHFVTYNGVMALIKEGNDSLFGYYTLLSKDFKKSIRGSAQPFISYDLLENVEILLPPLSSQKQIADILSAYDDLIENNNRRIKILEETAQKIYTEWFVNFRFSGHEKVKMVDSGTEFGVIPEGWEVKKLRDVITFYIGGGWGEEKQSEEFSVPGYVIRGTDIPAISSGDTSTAPFRFHKESNMKSRKAESLDIVFEVSGGSKGQPVGRHALITDSLLMTFHANVIFASFCKLIRINKNIVSPYVVSLFFNKLYHEEIISKYQVQSTGISNFRFEEFIDEVSVLVPDQKIRNNLDEIVSVFFELTQKIGTENLDLKKSRDLLIPQLVSGKLEVK